MQARTLLVVDDDDAFRNRLARAMEKRGYDVSAAATAKEAQQLAQDLKPEFAVVDLRMPGGSGLDVVQTLRQARKSMRIVILTGYGNIATAVAAVKVGAVDYLALQLFFERAPTSRDAPNAGRRFGMSTPPLSPLP